MPEAKASPPYVSDKPKGLTCGGRDLYFVLNNISFFWLTPIFYPCNDSLLCSIQCKIYFFILAIALT